MKFKTANVEILLAAVMKVIALVSIAFMIFAFSASRETRFGGPEPSWGAFTTCLSLGLFVLFFLREWVDDERVHSLKLKALGLAFAVSYLISMWFKPTRGGVESPLSAYEFFIITMIIALGLFHTWRWRDGRVNPPDQG
jgi:hypothetical protein